LRQLEGALAAVQTGLGRCVFVSGKAGIGKSRLIAEIRAQAITRGFTVLAGRCFEQDRSFPYAPLIDMLRLFFPQGAVFDWLDFLGPLASELVKLLPELAGRLPDSEPAAPLAPEVEKRRLFEALAGLFLHQAESGPLVLIVEDLHWSDQATLDLLAMTSNMCGDAAGTVAYYQRAIPILRKLNDRQTLASSLTMLSNYTLDESLAREAVELSREIDWRSGEAYALIYLGSLPVFRGDCGGD
jgi:predicted ATPase